MVSANKGIRYYKDAAGNRYFAAQAADRSVRGKHPGQYKVMCLNTSSNRVGVGTPKNNPWTTREEAEQHLESMAHRRGWGFPRYKRCMDYKEAERV